MENTLFVVDRRKKTRPALFCANVVCGAAIVALLFAMFLAAPFVLLIGRKRCRRMLRRVCCLCAALFRRMLYNSVRVEAELQNTSREAFAAQRYTHVVTYSNHVASIDFVCLLAANSAIGLNRPPTFFVKHSVLYMPLCGVFMYLDNHIFVRRSFEKDSAHIRRWAHEERDANIMFFPEGHRMTAQRKKASADFCRSTGLCPFEHVLVPRWKGFALLNSSFRGTKTALVSTTIMFYTSDGMCAPNIFGLLFLATCVRLVLKIRVYDNDAVDDVRAFLLEDFRRKDAEISAYLSEK